MAFGGKMAAKHHIEVEGRELVLSNLNKVYYPEGGFAAS
jgi:hypothetical protein